MPNITIRLDDSMLRHVRIWAAIHDTTVTEVVREFLQFLTRGSNDSLEPRETVPVGLLEELAETFNSDSELPFMDRD
ncbi:MAG TPA: hypothetical protein VME23_06555 [Terracidiphilus sp.]|nr:hypothetical protein [Terracidiphilus sp.]